MIICLAKKHKEFGSLSGIQLIIHPLMSLFERKYLTEKVYRKFPRTVGAYCTYKPLLLLNMSPSTCYCTLLVRIVIPKWTLFRRRCGWFGFASSPRSWMLPQWRSPLVGCIYADTLCHCRWPCSSPTEGRSADQQPASGCLTSDLILLPLLPLRPPSGCLCLSVSGGVHGAQFCFLLTSFSRFIGDRTLPVA